MSKKRPPIQFNDEQLLLQASNVADIYHQLALDLFDNVVERVTERGTVYLDKQPYIWQLEKMQQMHMLNKENLKLISERSGVAEEQLRHIVENEGLKLYTDTKQQLLEDLGRGSAGNSNHIQEILADYASQSIGDIHNLINTTLPMSVIGAYKGIVEQSVARVVTGLSTADKAISDTVMQWQEKGFQGFKDRGGRNWKIDNYARTVIKTTTYRTYREMRTRPAEELGIDTFYFSKKSSARKSCAPLQHHVVTTGHARTEHGEHILALSDYGYGRPEGCLGVNCGHMLTPFIPGANYKPDLGEDVDSVSPEQAIENANAEAKQRALERSIRANKEKLHVAEKLGDDDLINKYKSKIGTQKAALKDYIDKHPFLKRNEAREKYYDDPYTKAKQEVKLREEQKKARELATKRAELDKAVKSGKIVSVSGVTVGHTPPGKAGEPNSVVQHNATNGDVLGRTYYDDRGYKVKDIHFTNHKQPDKHPYGKKGEHVHDFVFDDDGKFISRTTRELTNNEREENLDILWRY
ncbi:phage minor capsid protein [Streptococcus mitis]|uniref:Phage minor capsid protein n=1 Tax=Streptococcus mitis TaxID=28037 RepID=A0A150NS07_STRMT|nr:phage minor capsid protein [Streptococcus mitis]KYF34891.1 Phage minor capsid protein [Streptococcus mitis]KYF36233.1 Phage minor capsid protein [Streptococcus mitis]QBX26317.1 minor capsid protein [Streptococcus phage Javan316]